MSLTLKLIIAGLIASLIGYSYFWTFSKGEAVGQAKEFQIQMQLLKEHELEFRELRAKEIREARAIFEREVKEKDKKVKDLNELNKFLLKQPKQVADCMAVPLDSRVISLLNESRGGEGTQPTGGDQSGTVRAPS
jgi:hypothetical protein